MQESLESEVLRLMLSENPFLLNQISRARKTHREFTGVGFYTDYCVDDLMYCEDNLQISGVGAKINKSIDVGFILFVEHEKKLICLECYAYDNSWPNVIETYEVYLT